MILIDAPHAGALLWELRTSGRTIPELPDGLRPSSWGEAYAIQDALHDVAGWDTPVLKVGCTGSIAQEALGIEEPIGGRIGATDVHESGATLSLADLHHTPLLECEYAFQLGDDVRPDDQVTGLDALRTLVDAVAPAIEVVDSRFDEILGASGPSLVADNSAAAAVVLGEPVPLADLDDMIDAGVALTAANATLAEGTGRAVLGDPLLSLEWAVQHEQNRGRAIPAGSWVITGTCTGMSPCPLNEVVLATFDGLGQVRFTLGK